MKSETIMIGFQTIVYFCAILLAVGMCPAQNQLENVFLDIDYQRHTWQSFEKLPQVHEELDFDDPSYSLLNAAVFFMTNKVRQKRGRAKFLFSASLRDMARQHSGAMAKYDFVGHKNPYQSKFRTTELRSRHFHANASAENVASSFLYKYDAGTAYYPAFERGTYAYYTPQGNKITKHSYLSYAQQVVQEWMDSPPHRKNILHKDLRSLGCAVIINPDAIGKRSVPLGHCTQNFSWR